MNGKCIFLLKAKRKITLLRYANGFEKSAIGGAL